MLVWDCANDLIGSLSVGANCDTSTDNFGVVAVVVAFSVALFQVIPSIEELTDVTSTTSLKDELAARVMFAVLAHI